MRYDELYTDEREARALLSHITEPADATVGDLVASYGAPTALGVLFDEHGKYALTPAQRDARKRVQSKLASNSPTMGELLAQWRSRGIHLLIPGDPDWPIGLDDLHERAPFALWVHGSTYAVGQLDRVKSVAIVGARAATSYGEHVATEMAGDLASRGLPIVSGAAYGIDGAVHRATLATDGITIAFLAGGADRPYPAGHADLIRRVAATGAVVSEVPPGSTPTRWRFLARNRLIAAASDVTIVVEAGFRSGSLNTAGHAVSLHRPLGAVPGPVTSAASAGCHRLIREFRATCITGAHDILQMLQIEPTPEPVGLLNETEV